MTTADGNETRLGIITDQLNLAFSVIFIVELLINLLGHWPRAFVENPWVSHNSAYSLYESPVLPCSSPCSRPMVIRSEYMHPKKFIVM